MLNFWASWCPPCADEAPDLNALSVRYGALGVRFVGVDFNDAVDEARAFAKRHDVPYALVHDTRGVRQAFGVTGPPETFVLDGSGRAIVRIEGPVDAPLLEPYLRVAVARSGGAAPLDPDIEVGGTTLSSLARHAAARRLRDAGLRACDDAPAARRGAARQARVIALSEGGAVDGRRRRSARHDRAAAAAQAQRALGVTAFPAAARDRRARPARGRAQRPAGARRRSRSAVRRAVAAMRRLLAPALGLVALLAAAALIAGRARARSGRAPRPSTTGRSRSSRPS